MRIFPHDRFKHCTTVVSVSRNYFVSRNWLGRLHGLVCFVSKTKYLCLFIHRVPVNKILQTQAVKPQQLAINTLTVVKQVVFSSRNPLFRSGVDDFRKSKKRTTIINKWMISCLKLASFFSSRDPLSRLKNKNEEH